MVVEICEFSSYNCTICYHKNAVVTDWVVQGHGHAKELRLEGLRIILFNELENSKREDHREKRPQGKESCLDTQIRIVGEVRSNFQLQIEVMWIGARGEGQNPTNFMKAT